MRGIALDLPVSRICISVEIAIDLIADDAEVEQIIPNREIPPSRYCTEISSINRLPMLVIALNFLISRDESYRNVKKNRACTKL